MMKKLNSDFQLEKYGLLARLVNENDADFIIRLRTDSKLSRFIHSTDNDVEKQKEWIRNYKVREANGEDYYFIFFKDNKPVGLNRIYSIHGTTFTTGSWVFDPDAPSECSILGSIIVREIAFGDLGFELEDGYDGCHVDNKQVLKFNKMIGLKETGRIQDVKGEYITMTLTKDDFYRCKSKMLKLLGYE